MKLNLTPLAFSLCLFGLCSVPAFAADNQAMDKLSQQVSELQQQVNQLQAQAAAPKNQKNTTNFVSTHHKTTAASNTPESPGTTTHESAPISGISTLPTDGTTYI